MSRSLAFASGIPALVYQVAWTREVGLIAGSQIEAISWVLVAFFGGLAAGARVLGGVADRSRVPLRTFAALEIGAGLGPFAGKAWRIGLMGHTARRQNVDLLLAALRGGP